jgi:CRP-like cAMP-binding protein
LSNIDLTDLSDSPLFKGLATKEIEYLSSVFSIRKIPEGKTVFIENMSGETLYLIKSGTVQISQMLAETDEQIMVVLGAGDIFGELAIIDEGPRASTARIAENAILYGLERKTFNLLASEKPRLGLQIALNVMKIFIGKMRAAKKDYRNMLLTALKR